MNPDFEILKATFVCVILLSLRSSRLLISRICLERIGHFLFSQMPSLDFVTIQYISQILNSFLSHIIYGHKALIILSIKFFFSFFVNFEDLFFFYVHEYFVYMYVLHCVCTWCPRRSEEDWDWFADGYESPWQVLCKYKCSHPLSDLFSLNFYFS